MKRGQVTVFVILGIIVIIAVILGFVLRQSFTESAAEAETKEIISFSDEVRDVRKHVEDCIGQALEDSWVLCNKPTIANEREFTDCAEYIVEDRTGACLDFSQFKMVKVIKEEDIRAYVNLDSKRTLLSATMESKIKIEKDENSETLSEFTSELLLKTKAYMG